MHDALLLILTFLYGFAGALLLRVSLEIDGFERLFFAVIGVLLLVMGIWQLAYWSPFPYTDLVIGGAR